MGGPTLYQLLYITWQGTKGRRRRRKKKKDKEKLCRTRYCVLQKPQQFLLQVKFSPPLSPASLQPSLCISFILVLFPLLSFCLLTLYLRVSFWLSGGLFFFPLTILFRRRWGYIYIHTRHGPSSILFQRYPPWTYHRFSPSGLPHCRRYRYTYRVRSYYTFIGVVVKQYPSSCFWLIYWKREREREREKRRRDEENKRRSEREKPEVARARMRYFETDVLPSLFRCTQVSHLTQRPQDQARELGQPPQGTNANTSSSYPFYQKCPRENEETVYEYKGAHSTFRVGVKIWNDQMQNGRYFENSKLRILK